MTTPEQPSSETPAPKPVLGIDPPAPKPAVPVAPAPVTPTPAPAPDTVQVDAQELAALQEAASNYNTLTGDEQLQAIIYGHLRDRASGIVSQPEQPAAQAPNGDPNGNPFEARLTRMEQFVQQGAQHIQQQNQIIQRQQDELASLRTDQFAKENPSFNNHQAEVAKLLKDNPSLGLENALTLVEAKAARAGNGTVAGANPPAPTTEGGSSGVMPNTVSPSGGVSDEAMANLAAKINDPKATPSLDDAFDAIGRAAGLDI